MEKRTKREDSETSGSLSITESVRRLASYNARADLDSEEQLLLFLQSWWSRTYNRPLKDPLLLSYTIEELLYEFYDRIERQKAQDELIDEQGDKMEEAKDKAAEDWAERMEREEREAELRSAAAKLDAEKSDPTKDPTNVAWMEEQLRVGKTVHGETFGEDIDDSFE